MRPANQLRQSSHTRYFLHCWSFQHLIAGLAFLDAWHLPRCGYSKEIVMNFRLVAAAAAVSGMVGTMTAQAADLPMAPAPMPKADIYAPISNWAGLHVGLQGGYAWGSSIETTFGNNTSPSGLFGGANIGYDFDLTNNWIFGVEADANIGDIKDSVVPAFGPSSVEQKLDYFGTVRGRLGYAMGSNLFYGTAGWAWGHGVRSAVGTPVASNSQSLSGWTVGAGIEHAFTPNVIGRLQYLYTDYGTANYNLGLGNVPVSLTTNAVSLGVNFKF
jgi:outer membrane immunogenic protein